MRKRFNHLCIFICCLIALVLYIAHETYNLDQCHANDCIRRVCQDYLNNKVSGSLCNDLCNTKEIAWHRCERMDLSLQAFISSDDSIVVCNYLWQNKSIEASSHDRKIELITKNLKQFVNAVSNLMNELYGKGDYNQIIKKILPLMDINDDKLFTSDEIMTLFSLLTSKDFLYRLLFWDSPYFPQVKGVCGSVYSLVNPSYTLVEGSLSTKRLSSHQTILGLTWLARMNLATNLLLTFSKGIRARLGSSHLIFCPMVPLKLGFNADYESQILFPTDVFYPSKLPCDNEGCSPPKTSDSCGKNCDKISLSPGAVNPYDSNHNVTCSIGSGFHRLCDLLEHGMGLLQGPKDKAHIVAHLRHLFEECRNLLGKNASLPDTPEAEVSFYMLRKELYDVIYDAVHNYRFDDPTNVERLKLFSHSSPKYPGDKTKATKLKNGFSYL